VPGHWKRTGKPDTDRGEGTSFTLIYSLETETDVDVYKFGCSKIGERWFLYRVELAGESTIYMVDSISFKDKGL